jgi:hypothetical protein
VPRQRCGAVRLVPTRTGLNIGCAISTFDACLTLRHPNRLTWRQRLRGTPRETRYQPHVSDDERPMARLAGIADDVEVGRVELPPRWSFERPNPGVQIWTTPAAAASVARLHR